MVFFDKIFEKCGYNWIRKNKDRLECVLLLFFCSFFFFVKIRELYFVVKN